MDHEDSGRTGSKDAADAICGALWNASKHAEEFDFEYGETLDSIIQADKASVLEDAKQINVDFEELLKRTISHEVNSRAQKTGFQDFGFGRATSNFNLQYLNDGIII